MAFNFDRDMLEAAFKKHAAAEGGNDTLNQREFAFMFTELVGRGKYEVDDIIAMFEGVCGVDDQITFDEFWTALTGKPVTEKQLRGTFADYDKDGSGMLSKDEVTAAFSSMPNKPSDEDITKVLDKVDSNDDGKISIDEFLALWN